MVVLMSDTTTESNNIADEIATTLPKRRTWTKILFVLAIPLVVVFAGIVTTWWRPVTLILICPIMKMLGYSKSAEPFALRAVELYAKDEGMGSKHTMTAVWHLAEIYSENGKFKKAEPLYKLLATYNAAHKGDGAVAPFQVLRAWAKSLRVLGNIKLAEKLEAEAKAGDP